MMRNDLKDVVKSVSNIVKPYSGMVVLDIGSNDNTLLNFYPKKLSFMDLSQLETSKK